MQAMPGIKRALILLVTGSLMAAGTVAAELNTPAESPTGIRTEAWLALSSWPGLSELQPAAGGSFKQIGYSIGAAAHWPVRQLANGELLLGVEGAIMATDSDVPVFLDELLARHAYLAVSAKWRMGTARNVSLDAGLGFHLVNIAQLETDYNSASEFESWEESAAGLFIGATWDVGAGRPNKNSGLSLGLRVHFVDLGTVRDEEVFFTPVLGADAGELTGPLYVLRIGYRWR
jgi:hypothetical protein